MHDLVDRQARYGHREDGLRFYCAEANRLIAELAEMPNVDLRWGEGRWCLAHGYLALSPSLDWLSTHPDQDRFPCTCSPVGKPPSGAPPAGTIVDGGDYWVIELDLRLQRELLVVPLQKLVRRIKSGGLAAGHLPLAYNVDWHVRSAGRQLAEGVVLQWGSGASR